MKITAYKIGPAFTLEPGVALREWQKETPNSFAQRCLPMLIANQAGWVMLNPCGFTATYHGGVDSSTIEIAHDEDGEPGVRSHFGSGLLTWTMPYLFRTEPGVQLWVRGPANHPKDGVSPLEGIVETDHATQTFTMNWFITRQNHPIRFEKDEPFCMITPIRLADLESAEPEMMLMSKASLETQKQYLTFRDVRGVFNYRKHIQNSEEHKEGWQKHYFMGTHVSGEPFPEHRMKLSLKKFEEK